MGVGEEGLGFGRVGALALCDHFVFHLSVPIFSFFHYVIILRSHCGGFASFWDYVDLVASFVAVEEWGACRKGRAPSSYCLALFFLLLGYV